jgi:hypothetical protein
MLAPASRRVNPFNIRSYIVKFETVKPLENIDGSMV